MEFDHEPATDEQVREYGVNAQPDVRRLIARIASDAEITKELRMQLLRVIGVGHNDQCLFCGFKDKVAKRC